MTEIRGQLVALYSKAPVEEVHRSAEYQRLCKRYGDDVRTKRRFYEEHERVERLREQIDTALGGKPTAQQIEMALRLVWRFRGSEFHEDFIEMVVAAYGGGWSAVQRDYFEESAKALTEARPYFLSFTSRHGAWPAVNQLNRNHQHFILDALGPKGLENADTCKQNLLAQAIHHHLLGRRPGGFFFPQHKEDNQEVEEKLLKALQNSLAFVQLVQGELFRLHREGRNWCHFEHEMARREDPARILFVQVDPEIEYDQVHLDFEDWYQHFARKDAIKLLWTRWGEEKDNVETNFQKVTRELVAQIDRARDRIYLGIPEGTLN